MEAELSLPPIPSYKLPPMASGAPHELDPRAASVAGPRFDQLLGRPGGDGADPGAGERGPEAELLHANFARMFNEHGLFGQAAGLGVSAGAPEMVPPPLTTMAPAAVTSIPQGAGPIESPALPAGAAAQVQAAGELPQAAAHDPVTQASGSPLQPGLRRADRIAAGSLASVALSPGHLAQVRESLRSDMPKAAPPAAPSSHNPASLDPPPAAAAARRPRGAPPPQPGPGDAGTAQAAAVHAGEEGVSVVARTGRLSREERLRLTDQVGELLARYGLAVREIVLDGELIQLGAATKGNEHAG